MFIVKGCILITLKNHDRRNNSVFKHGIIPSIKLLAVQGSMMRHSNISFNPLYVFLCFTCTILCVLISIFIVNAFYIKSVIPSFMISIFILPVFIGSFHMLNKSVNILIMLFRNQPVIEFTEKYFIDNYQGVKINWGNIKNIDMVYFQSKRLSISLRNEREYYSKITNPFLRCTSKLNSFLLRNKRIYSVSLFILKGKDYNILALFKSRGCRVNS